MHLPSPGPDLDQLLSEIPDQPAVFVLHLRTGRPYIGRTTRLARRIRRLLGMESFSVLAVELEFWLTPSNLSAALHLYDAARRYAPERYLQLIRLRMPSYVRLLSHLEFPRTAVSTRLSRAGTYLGPFRTRASAEAFEASVLEHFQVRRCTDELEPSAAHPGCMYGEMRQCLRPCQLAVSTSEYRNEVHRLQEAFETGGRSIADLVAANRDRLSAEMEFEEAARQHQRLERITATWRLRDELAMPLDALHGIAVTPAVEPDSVEIRLLIAGSWQARELFGVSQSTAGERPVSLDRRLREMLERPLPPSRPLSERQEHLALLARWAYSSWRDGEWLAIEQWSHIPYRRLGNMVNRVASQERPSSPSKPQN